MTTCSLTSNSTYSLKCEKEDTGINVIQLLEELFILVAASFENFFKTHRSEDAFDDKRTEAWYCRAYSKDKLMWEMTELLGRYLWHKCCFPGAAAQENKSLDHPLKKNVVVKHSVIFFDSTIDLRVPKGGRIKKGWIAKYWRTFGYNVQVGVNVIML